MSLETSEDFVHNGEARGPGGQRAAVEAFLSAFDPLVNSIEITFGEGDMAGLMAQLTD